jgi:hypothetical protein
MWALGALVVAGIATLVGWGGAPWPARLAVGRTGDAPGPRRWGRRARPRAGRPPSGA